VVYYGLYPGNLLTFFFLSFLFDGGVCESITGSLSLIEFRLAFLDKLDFALAN
jgi:hypothetical protein